jgi:hypothetical protein
MFQTGQTQQHLQSKITGNPLAQEYQWGNHENIKRVRRGGNKSTTTGWETESVARVYRVIEKGKWDRIKWSLKEWGSFDRNCVHSE